jgi:hypothetical protein
VTKLVGGFTTPIDAEIIGNRIYVIEYSGNQGVWEITFPPTRVTLTNPLFQSSGFKFTITGAVPGAEYQIQASTNLTNWTSLTNMVGGQNTFEFTDTAANSYRHRFYRVFQP